MKVLIVRVEFDDSTNAEMLRDDVTGALEDFRDRERPVVLVWTVDEGVPGRKGEGYDE